MHKLFETLGLAAILGLLPAAAMAQAPVGAETGFVLNTFAFLIWGALVMWMCAGFTMLEAGSVRTKNASVICMKNIGLYSIAGLTYYVIGYNVMYVDVDGGFFGSFSLFRGNSASEIAFLNAAPDVIDQARETLLADSSGHATMSDWFFQMVFVATTASIISGALAERVRLWSFFLFVAILTAFIYPIVGAWTWAAAGWPKWASRTLRGRRSCTRPGAGPHCPAPCCLARGAVGSARTAPSGRCRHRTSPSSRWACSSFGWAGSVSTAVPSWH